MYAIEAKPLNGLENEFECEVESRVASNHLEKEPQVKASSSIGQTIANIDSFKEPLEQVNAAVKEKFRVRYAKWFFWKGAKRFSETACK